jgi:RNA polymerase sigma-54 factor
MRIDTSLHQRLEQRMVLAPRMIQAMEILQLPLMALQERIDEELIGNPVLEQRVHDAEAPEPADGDELPSGGADGGPLPDEKDLVVPDDGSNKEDFERLGEVVDRWESYFDDEVQWRAPRPASGEPDRKAEAMQNAPDASESLQEQMLNLWHLEEVPPRIAQLGELVIRNLDDNGYVRVPVEDLAREVQPPATDAEMEEALARVQQIGPTGVAARNLAECLLLQLRAKPGFAAEDGGLNENALEVRIVRHHLHDLEANRYPQMSRALGASIEEIQSAVQTIRHLNPKPGAALGAGRTPPIIPDVKVEFDEETGDYRVTVNGGDTPELYISRTYRRLVRQRDLDAETRRFVVQNIRSARWLMDAIEQRRDTLRRVVLAILKFQRPFFDEGPDRLQPLKMQQIADEVHLHVATISRAVSDKYVDTSWGIYAIRDFFSGGTQTSQGEDVSWDQVRGRLKIMIEAEDKTHPLSDDEIMQRFAAEGVPLARRTVAKYREELGIPSSRKRRQF